MAFFGWLQDCVLLVAQGLALGKVEVGLAGVRVQGLIHSPALPLFVQKLTFHETRTVAIELQKRIESRIEKNWKLSAALPAMGSASATPAALPRDRGLPQQRRFKHVASPCEVLDVYVRFDLNCDTFLCGL